MERSGAARKRKPSERSTLRPHEGVGSGRKTRPHCGTCEEIVGLRGGLPLPTMMALTNVFSPPLQRVEPHVLQSVSGHKRCAQRCPGLQPANLLNMVLSSEGSRNGTVCNTSAQLDQNETCLPLCALFKPKPPITKCRRRLRCARAAQNRSSRGDRFVQQTREWNKGATFARCTWVEEMRKRGVTTMRNMENALSTN